MADVKKYTWNDITISQFEQIMSICKMEIDGLEKSVKLISVIEGLDEDYYEELPVTEFADRVKSLSFISETTPQKRFNGGTYMIGGGKFKLTMNASKMTTGQFIDYQSFIGVDNPDIASLCSVFLIPDGKKYGEDYDFDELRELIRDQFKMIDAMGISFFFLKTYEVLSSVTLRYFCRKLKKEQKKTKDPEKIKTLTEAISKIESAMSGKELSGR